LHDFVEKISPPVPSIAMIPAVVGAGVLLKMKRRRRSLLPNKQVRGNTSTATCTDMIYREILHRRLQRERLRVRVLVENRTGTIVRVPR